MKKLLKKFGKRSRRRNSSEDESPNTSTASPRPETFGLFLLAESAPNPSDHEHYPVDIIAVHGLNGDAYTTWTHANGTFWLHDLLPNFLPGCRVYTYGYPSQVAFSTSFAEVEDYSRRLLSSIRDVYEHSDQGSRSIIFVCHSLGGLIFKKVLVCAHEDNMIYGEILKSIAGVIFLGTPHRGSDVANLGRIVGRILNTCITATSAGMQTGTINTDLLDYLKPDSKELQRLTNSVRNRLFGLTVVSFYENAKQPPFSLIVDKKSSILDIPGEELIPLWENHRDICRFSGETESYKAVSQALRRIARSTRATCPTPKRTSTHSSQRTLDEFERACMSQFSVYDVADYRRMLPTPAKGTCQWILSHPSFVSWLEKSENALLWLTGHPGCGKTTISFFIAKHLEEARSPRSTSNVCVFFCDDRVSKQKDATSILNGLIFQIVGRHRSLVRYAKRVFEIQGQNMFRSFTSLWDILVKTATDPKSGTTYIIIDALDECEKLTRNNLLDSIRVFSQASNHSVGSKQQVKFVLTCQASLIERENSIEDVTKHRIPIDEGQAGYDGDLRTFIQQRVDEIAQRRNLAQETKKFLQETLYSRADQTFLWIHMVLASLENSLLASKKDFQDIITRIPPNLEATYMRFLSLIPLGYQGAASKLLQLILGSVRPLNLDEINIAFTIDSSHRTSEDIALSSQPAILHTINGVLGPLVRVSNSKVVLVHHSAKEFLLQRIGADNNFATIYAISEEESALLIASACIHYLLLEDFSVDFFSLEKSASESSSESSDRSEMLHHSVSPKNFWDEDVGDLDVHVLFREHDLLDADVCQSLVSKHAFYQYASLHWTEHFARCETSATVELREAAKRLLDMSTTSCSNWLRFLSTEVAAIDRSIPNSRDPVTLAACFNLHETLKDILSGEEFISGTHKDHALFWAAQEGHNRNLGVLLRAGANPNAQILGRQTALITAAQNGHLDCVDTLLADPRTDLNVHGRNGRTAFSFACGNGHYEVVKALLGRDDCRFDEEDDTGATALFWATGGGHIHIITELARRLTVDVNYRDKKGRTALSWAAGDGMEEPMKALLRVRGVDANLEDHKGRSPLSWAAGNGCTAAVRLLLRNSNVDKASLDQDQRNAISWASAGGHLDTLRMLLKYGCPGVNDKDIDGWTPLAWAIQNNSPGTVEALISSRLVDLEVRDHGGRTALSWAVEYGHIEVVRTLLREGADPQSKSNKGATPVSAAESFGRDDILHELLHHMKENVPKEGQAHGGMHVNINTEI